MKKILILISSVALFSCGKQIEEVIVEKKVEKIIETAPEIKQQTSIAYYFEEQPSIRTNKKENEQFVTIDWHQDELFLGVEATNGTSKSYSVQKLDLQTGELTEVISNLKGINDVAFSDKHIFVTQENTVRVFDRKTFLLHTIIGSGREGYGNNGMFHALALYPTENNLLVRDLRRLLFYRNSDITPENSKKISAPVKSGFAQRNTGSLAHINDKLYFAYGNEIETYDLQENITINNEQSPSKRIRLNAPVLQLAHFRGHLYGSMGERGFARIDMERGNVSQNYTHYQSVPLKVTRFAFSNDQLFAISNTDANIIHYQVKEVIYKEY